MTIYEHVEVGLMPITLKLPYDLYPVVREYFTSANIEKDQYLMSMGVKQIEKKANTNKPKRSAFFKRVRIGRGAVDISYYSTSGRFDINDARMQLEAFDHHNVFSFEDASGLTSKLESHYQRQAYRGARSNLVANSSVGRWLTKSKTDKQKQVSKGQMLLGT